MCDTLVTHGGSSDVCINRVGHGLKIVSFSCASGRVRVMVE